MAAGSCQGSNPSRRRALSEGMSGGWDEGRGEQSAENWKEKGMSTVASIVLIQEWPTSAKHLESPTEGRLCHGTQEEV